MNYKHIYQEYSTQTYEEQAHDMERAIIYLSKHFFYLPHDFRVAHRELTAQEKNDIIRDVCLPF